MPGRELAGPVDLPGMTRLEEGFGVSGGEAHPVKFGARAYNRR